MLKVDDIKRVHLELSSICNARCAGCPRNLFGYPYNNGYIERNLTLKEVKHIFKDIIKQLEMVRVNGNFGDFVSNNESPEIFKWMLEQNTHLLIKVSTNGSAQSKAFWRSLGKLGMLKQGKLLFITKSSSIIFVTGKPFQNNCHDFYFTK